MGKQNDFNRKGKLYPSATPVTEKKFTAPMLGLEDVFFTWGMVSNAVRYANVVDKLKEHVAVHFWDQATVAARAMEELKAPTFVKAECPVRKYWRYEGQTLKTKNERNAGSTTANVPKTED